MDGAFLFVLLGYYVMVAAVGCGECFFIMFSGNSDSCLVCFYAFLCRPVRFVLNENCGYYCTTTLSRVGNAKRSGRVCRAIRIKSELRVATNEGTYNTNRN